jgi:hypothetical protein
MAHGQCHTSCPDCGNPCTRKETDAVSGHACAYGHSWD